MQNQLPYCVQIVQALGPTIIAVVVGAIAAWVAFRQWKTANDKLRLDLFEKRYDVYNELRVLLATTLQNGTVTYEEVMTFCRETKGAEFLFGTEVESYLDQIRDRLNKLAYHEGQIRAGPQHSGYDNHVERAYEIKSSVEDELLNRARPIFEKYLSFSHLK